MDNILEVDARVGTIRQWMKEIMEMMYTCVTVDSCVRFVYSYILFNEIIWKDPENWTPFKARVWNEDHVPFLGEAFRFIHGIGFSPYRSVVIAKPLMNGETDPNEEIINGERVVKIPIPVVYRMGEFDIRTVEVNKTTEIIVVDVLTDKRIPTILWSTRCPPPSINMIGFLTAGGRLLPTYKDIKEVYERTKEIARREAQPNTVLASRDGTELRGTHQSIVS
jgi:hypothetical protein